MAKGVFGGSFKGVDGFGKTADDVKIKTRTGAFLTLVSAAIITTFMMIEFFDYRRVSMDTSIVVDKSRGEKLTVNMGITFPHVPCYLLSLDVMDISGEQQRDLTHNIIKSRLDPQGQAIEDVTAHLGSDLDKAVAGRGEGFCGSCYGGTPPESGCCNTCEEVRQAYVNRGWSFGNPDSIDQCVSEGWSDKIKDQAAEGCNISGRIRVNKVVGNIHLSPGRSFQTHTLQVHDLVPYLRETNGQHHDFGHTIQSFGFESDDEWDLRKKDIGTGMKKRLGIDVDPLVGVAARTTKTQYMFQYFLKVVSTQFRSLDGQIVNTHQYSVTHFERDLTEGTQANTAQGLHLSHGMSGVPGAFFNFEISPILVVHTEVRQSFAHFLTSTCAIVGGVLTIASMIDQVLFATGRAFKKGSAMQNGYGGKLM
ncbi:endoplasmic reticulum-derived transport vesicle ERV46 [Gautieria morchelliformis]|nr:endoplasmic reticulum-derived transport vesicle ERV46 [Gautieria morchelliformis]